MKYISTRSGEQGPKLNFKQTTLNGLAEDGGLYVPITWPQLSTDTIKSMKSLSYADLASFIISHFSGDTLSKNQLDTIAKEAYADFDDPDIAPLVELEDNIWVLELFHGPTLAFKDFALQILGRLLETYLSEDDQNCVIVGATSGDTGSAAIEAVRGKERITLVMLHPDGRVSDVQRKQMTSVDENNIVNLAVDGTFDDCQDFVKAFFKDGDARETLKLTAVNSINWARVAAQVVYYFFAALKLGAPEREIAFSVPTGNFGNILAGYIAKQMGLPIKKLIIGSNSNDILTRFTQSGIMETKDAVTTASPSMDIQVSSNFERLLFELLDRDATKLSKLQHSLSEDNKYQLDAKTMRRFSELFEAHSLDDTETEAVIKSVYDEHNYILDPHSAIGVAAARQSNLKNTPIIALATAAPAKFNDIVEKATGAPAPIPQRLENILEAPEKFQKISNDFASLRSAVYDAYHQRKANS